MCFLFFMKKMGDTLENINPKLYKKINEREITAEDEDEDIIDEFDTREIFGMYLLIYVIMFLAFKLVHTFY